LCGQAILGAWLPWPTQPAMTPSTACGYKVVLAKRAFIVSMNRCSGEMAERLFVKCPMGVLTPPQRTTLVSRTFIGLSYSQTNTYARQNQSESYSRCDLSSALNRSI